MSKPSPLHAIGRRKSSTAKAYLLKDGHGSIKVNGQDISAYFKGNISLINKIQDPLVLIGAEKKYDLSIQVRGGGFNGQAEACRHAISKILSTLDEGTRGTLKKAGYMKRDPREKERKKHGLRRARKAEQFSKR